jgi:hypothetical protein
MYNVLQEMWLIMNLPKIAECIEVVFHFLIANRVGTDLTMAFGMFRSSDNTYE